MKKQSGGAKPEDQIQQVSKLLLDVLKAAIDSTARQASELGLRPPQVMFILGLHDEGRLSMREVSRKMDVHPAVLTRQMDRLVDKGLIERTRDDADRRLVYVSLTKQGIKTAEEVLAFYNSRIEEALYGVGPAEKETLRRVLTLMKERLPE